jgi:hypothetical protein
MARSQALTPLKRIELRTDALQDFSIQNLQLSSFILFKALGPARIDGRGRLYLDRVRESNTVTIIPVIPLHSSWNASALRFSALIKRAGRAVRSVNTMRGKDLQADMAGYRFSIWSDLKADQDHGKTVVHCQTYGLYSTRF